MRTFLASAALFLSLFSQKLETGTITIPLSAEVSSRLESNWKIEEVFLNENNPSSSDLILLTQKNKRCFITGNQVITEGKIKSQDLFYTKDENQFILKTSNGRFEQFFTATRKSKAYDKIEIIQPEREDKPVIMMKKDEKISLYDGKRQIGPILAKSFHFHQHTGDQYLAELNLHSIQKNGQWIKQCRVVENGVLSPLIRQVFLSEIINEQISWLFESEDGQFFIKNGINLSKPFISAKMINKELVLFQSDKGNWHLYHRGKLLGPYLEPPQAIKQTTDGEFVWITKTHQGWQWMKEGITIIDTEAFAFSADDIHFYKNSFALIRKEDKQYHIYSNFEKQVSFSQKPTIQFINEKLLSFHGIGEQDKHFYGIAQLDTRKLLVEQNPLDIKVFEHDYFDFWLRRGDHWSAYLEGKAIGSIKTADINELVVFIVKNSLFFPDWNYQGNGKIMLANKAGQIGPFDTINPLEHPNQEKSKSTLYSSFTAKTSEGELAVYGDSIIGPYDRVYPNLDFNNEGKIIGLFIEVADQYYYFTTEKGMVLETQKQIKSIELKEDGTVEKQYELIEMSDNRKTAVEINKKKRAEAIQREIPLFYQNKEMAKTAHYKIHQSGKKQFLFWQDRAEASILFPSGKQINFDHWYKAELTHNSEMLIFSKDGKGKLFFNHKNSQNDWEEIMITNLTRLFYYSTANKEIFGELSCVQRNQRDPDELPWFAVEREFSGDAFYQIYKGDKALFLIKKDEAEGVTLKEFSQGKMLMLSIPHQEKRSQNIAPSRSLEKISSKQFFINERGPTENFSLLNSGRVVELRDDRLIVYLD